MINLLPTATKQSYGHARQNVGLRRWVIRISLAIVVQLCIVAGGMWYIANTAKSLAAENETAKKVLSDQKLEETQKQLSQIGTDLKLVNQVLSKQVQFSELLKQVGSSMPSGAVLTDLSIGKVSGGIDIKAAAVSQATATQIQLNLQDPSNKVFDKVDIVNITCSDTSYGGKYPCSVQLRASFNSCNQFLVISNGCQKQEGAKQ